MEQEVFVSPTILNLQRELQSGNWRALKEFWERVKESGAPLVEALEDQAEEVLLTFVWQAQEEIENVVVFGGFPGQDLQNQQLHHLAGSDLWYRTYRVSVELQASYEFSINDTFAANDWLERVRHAKRDPFNPHTFVIPKGEQPDGFESVKSFLQPFWQSSQVGKPVWHECRDDVAYGEVARYAFHSECLSNDRDIWVVTPAGYSTEWEPYRLLVLFDGWCYLHLVPTPTIVGNLQAAGGIPPLVTVLINNSAGKRQEELAANPAFLDCMANEILPWVRERYHVTDDPSQTIVAGSSLGGLSAMFAATSRPDVFGHVLCQSGAFWWEREAGVSYADSMQVVSTFPRHVYMDVGIYESQRMLNANRKMKMFLEEQGASFQYKEIAGGHDFAAWRGTFADALQWIVGKMEASKNK